MADTCKVNNIYYDCKLYNSTSYPIAATVNDILSYSLLNNNLLYPIVNNDSYNYSVAVNKAKIDLSSVPLTKTNIPFKKYQIGVKYGSNISTFNVQQVNPNGQTGANYIWNCPIGSTIITKYQYTNSGLQFINSINVGTICSYVKFFIVDNFENIYIAGSNISYAIANTLFIIDQYLNLILSQTYTQIVHIYIDNNQTLYISDIATTPTVNIYLNTNQQSSVILTFVGTLTKTFTGGQFVNLLFCIADETIIIGYGTNQITMYNATYTAISDNILASVSQLQNIAQINKSSNTFTIVDITNAYYDQLIVTISSNGIWDIRNNSQLSTINFISNIVVMSNGYAYGIGTNGFTYATNWPIPGNPITINNITQLNRGCIFANVITNTNLYAVNTSNNLVILNYTVPFGISPNTWITVGTYFTNNGTSFINIDYQISTNKIFAVDSTNNLYISTTSIAPQNIYAVNQNTIYVYGVWPAPNQNNVMQSNLIQTAIPSLLYTHTLLDIIHINNYLYATTFDGTNTYISQFNTSNFIATGIIYLCNDLINPNFGLKLAKLGTNFMVAGHIVNSVPTQIAIYNPTSGSLVSITPSLPSSDSIVSMCDFGDNVHMFIVGNNGFVYAYDYTTNPATLVNFTNIGYSPLPNGKSACVANILDLSFGGFATFFVLIDDMKGLGQNLLVIGYPKGLNNPAVIEQLIYSNLANGTISDIGCNSNFGQLYVFMNYTTWNVLYKSNAYSTTSGNFSTITSITAQYTYYIDSDISYTPVWTQVNTNGFKMIAINVSRQSSNTLYAIGLTNSLLYTGTFNANTTSCTFQQMSQFINTYLYISSNELTNPVITNTNIDCFTIDSQTLANSYSVNGNITSVSVNDITNEYLVASHSSNQIDVALSSYDTTSFVQNWSLTLTNIVNIGNIFVKSSYNIYMPMDIYNISIFINAINDAFVFATNKLNYKLSLSLTPPVLSLNYTSGLCTLLYDVTFSQSGNGILLNNALLIIVQFESSLDFQSDMNLIKLYTNNQSVPTGMITQGSKSIYLFNQLDKILVLSNTITIVGPYSSSILNLYQNAQQILTDINVPTNSFVENIGQVIYYTPSFLSPNFLQQNLDLKHINLSINYIYTDFSQYQLMLNPGQNFTTKLQFIRKT